VEASPVPAKRISPGEVVSETFSLYGRHVVALLGSAVVVFVIFGLASGLIENSGGFLLALVGSIVRLAGHALYTGFVVTLVQDVRDGRRDQTIGDMFASAAPVIPSLIGFSILFALGVGIGLILLIVPGLILLTFWCLGAPVIVIEREGALEAFGRSRRLVSGEAWSVFGTLVVVLLIVIAIGVILGVIATPISNAATDVASIISSAISAPIFALAVSVMYFRLGGGGAPEGAVSPAGPTGPPPPPAPPA
jgi:hypothetical protein